MRAQQQQVEATLAIDELLRTPMSRREALKRVAAAGLVLPGVSVAVSACGGGAGTAGGTTLVITSGAKPVTLDPMVSFDGQSPLLWRCSYETLVRYKGATAELEPHLAESFEFEATRKPRLVFHLREGATFSDGTPVDAAAVKLSIERQIAVKNGIAYALTALESIETPDDHTVVVNFKRYVDGQPQAFGGQLGLYIISPKAIGEHKGGDWAQTWLRSNMVGSGPYVLTDYKLGQQATFARNEKYWGGWDGDHFERVIVKYTTDPSAQRLSLVAGESDLALFLPDDVLHSLRKQAKIDVRSFDSWTVQYIGLPCRTGPTAKRTVRQALSYGFDYDSYVKDVLDGDAKQPHGPLPDSFPSFNAGVRQYNYDPDRARKMLAEAGFEGGGFGLKYVYETGYSWKRPLGELFQANMKDLGIKVSIQELSPATWVATLSNKQNADHAYGVTWWPSIATPYDFLWNLFATSAQGSAGYNFQYYSNRTYDRLIEDASAEPDAGRRDRLFGQAQQIVVDDAPCLFVAQPQYLQPQSPKLEGYSFNGAYIYLADAYGLHE